MELVAPAGANSQEARWFVSHWWGMPVKDFVKALRNHAEVRGLTKNAAYWVCAYASDQHNIFKDTTDDPKDSGFFKAMQRCDGVLVVLDEDARLFSRISCCSTMAPTSYAYAKWCSDEVMMTC